MSCSRIFYTGKVLKSRLVHSEKNRGSVLSFTLGLMAKTVTNVPAPVTSKTHYAYVYYTNKCVRTRKRKRNSLNRVSLKSIIFWTAHRKLRLTKLKINDI